MAPSLRSSSAPPISALITILVTLVSTTFVIGCPGRTNDGACNSDDDCIPGDRCLEGFCTRVLITEGEGEGGEGEGEEGEGEGEGGEGEGGEGEGGGES